MAPRALHRLLAVAAVAVPWACGLNPQPDLPFGGGKSEDSGHQPGSPNIGGTTSAPSEDPGTMGPSAGGFAGTTAIPMGGSASSGGFSSGGTAPTAAAGGGAAGEAPNGGDNGGGAGPESAAGAGFGGAQP